MNKLQVLYLDNHKRESNRSRVRLSLDRGNFVQQRILLPLIAEFDTDLAESKIINFKSIEIKSDSFTKDEADAYLEEYKNQLGDLDNFNIDGLTSVDDLVIDAQIVETGDPLKPYRVVAEFTPSEGDTIKGVAEEVNITFVAPETPDIEIPETFIPELEPPVVSPTVGS